MATHGNRGTPEGLELVPDPARPGGWTLMMAGVPQSYVDVTDPEHLQLAYVRLIARALRARHAVPGRILHLGAGGMTVPRLAARWWPGVAQTVVEISGELIDVVMERIPPAFPVEIVVGDARHALETTPDRRYDVIVVDVFHGAAMPAHLGTVEFSRHLRRVLRPGGLAVMNVTDVPPTAFTRIRVATVAAAFDEVAVFGETAVLKGRRAGNLILLAGAVPSLRVSRGERLLREGELVVFSGGARPRTDAES
ncbi:spermidine synthase [Actinoplanes sp. NPDC020271]|uniref:spermidine synthase n=1 Tax=Actinoplanes sp. NPDC020271 TaxID=3363896 RepID=UPI0037BCF72B